MEHTYAARVTLVFILYLAIFLRPSYTEGWALGHETLLLKRCHCNNFERTRTQVLDIITWI